MATTINKEEILKAVQAMTKEERLKLIAEIAGLPDSVDEPAAEQLSLSQSLSDREVTKAAGQFMDNHKTLLRRLAQ
jgi:hypothetical protein